MDWTAPLPPGLVAKPDRPQCSSKHKSWFEFIENKDKKKKLEIEVMTDRNWTSVCQTGAYMCAFVRVMRWLTSNSSPRIANPRQASSLSPLAIPP